MNETRPFYNFYRCRTEAIDVTAQLGEDQLNCVIQRQGLPSVSLLANARNKALRSRGQLPRQQRQWACLPTQPSLNGRRMPLPHPDWRSHLPVHHHQRSQFQNPGTVAGIAKEPERSDGVGMPKSLIDNVFTFSMSHRFVKSANRTPVLFGRHTGQAAHRS